MATPLAAVDDDPIVAAAVLIEGGTAAAPQSSNTNDSAWILPSFKDQARAYAKPGDSGAEAAADNLDHQGASPASPADPSGLQPDS